MSPKHGCILECVLSITEAEPRTGQITEPTQQHEWAAEQTAGGNGELPQYTACLLWAVTIPCLHV